MCPKEIGWEDMDRIQLSQDGVQVSPLMNVMNPQAP
jgi:hypothetical protein